MWGWDKLIHKKRIKILNKTLVKQVLIQSHLTLLVKMFYQQRKSMLALLTKIYFLLKKFLTIFVSQQQQLIIQ
jgi:hypothetical protein